MLARVEDMKNRKLELEAKLDELRAKLEQKQKAREECTLQLEALNQQE